MTHDELLDDLAKRGMLDDVPLAAVKDVRAEEGMALEEEAIAAVHAIRREDSAHKFARLEGVAT
jgi:hypothetical protein